MMASDSLSRGEYSSMTGPATINISSSNLSAGNNLAVSVVVNEPVSMLRQLKIDLDPVDAAHNSYTPAANQRSTCLAGTRVQLLEEIDAWIQGHSLNQASIFVLDGVAGIGKTTVAQTVAERTSQTGILGASFFFSRDEERRKTGEHFLSTVAYQLSSYDAKLARCIFDGVKGHPDIAQKDIHQQFTTLILQPFRSVQSLTKSYVLVIIDALDECDEKDARSILTLLGENTPYLPNLKFFITARPEWHIRDVLDHASSHQAFHLHEIEDSIVQSDIRLYLDFFLSAEYVSRVFPYMQLPWHPTEAEKQMLYGICGTLFIIASTTTKFILDNKYPHPQKQLSRLLEGVSSVDYSGSQGTDALDRFYVQILRSALPDILEMADHLHDYQTVLGAIIVLQNPLPHVILARLLGIGADHIEGTLLHLHSLVAPTSNERVFRIHHKSFPDFITSEDRIKAALGILGLNDEQVNLGSRRLFIDSRTHHKEMAKRCFHVMHYGLKRNMGNLTPRDWYRDKKDVAVLLQMCPIPQELSYACLHWATHLCAGELDEEVLELLVSWVSQHLLTWLEALSIMKREDAACSMLDSASAMMNSVDSYKAVSSGSPASRLSGFFPRLRAVLSPESRHSKEDSVHVHVTHKAKRLLDDSYRFSQKNLALLRVSPMHIYWSGAPFLPVNTSIYALYCTSSNGLQLISGTANNWSPELSVLLGHTNVVRTVIFSPDGSRVASASDDRTVRLWDGKTGYPIATLCGHSSFVKTVAFSSDGLRLASASDDHTARLWNAKTGAEIATLSGHSDRVTSIAFSPDGSKLASGSSDNAIRIWDGKSGCHILTLKGHTNGITAIVFSPDNSRLASGADDHTVRWWDSQTGSCLATSQGHEKRVTDVALSTDGSVLASGSDDGSIRLWSADTGEQITSFRNSRGTVDCLALSPDGRRLVAGFSNDKVRLYDVGTRSKVATLSGHSRWILSVAFSPDAMEVASGAADNTIRIWDAKTGSYIATFRGHTGWVESLAFSPDGQRIVTGSADCTVRLWESRAIHQVSMSLENDENGQGSRIKTLAFSPDGSRLAWGSDDYTVKIKNCATGADIILRGHRAWVVSLEFSPDGLRLASSSQDSTVRIWNGKTGSHVTTLRGHEGWIECVTWSPNSLWLASGSIDRTIRIWDGKTGSNLDTFQGRESSVTSLVFSPDGEILASGYVDSEVVLWDVRTGSQIAVLKGHTGPITWLVFSPDGSRLVSGAIQDVSRVWDCQVRSQVASLGENQIHEVVGGSNLTDQLVLANTTLPSQSNPTAVRILTPLRRRMQPQLYGLGISVPWTDSKGDSEWVPIAWLPSDVHVSAFAYNDAKSVVAIGCVDGRILILDLSKVILP